MVEQLTIYCGKPHRTSDGVPVEHACRVLLPAFLEAERTEDFGRAADVLEGMPLVLHRGVPHGQPALIVTRRR